MSTIPPPVAPGDDDGGAGAAPHGITVPDDLSELAHEVEAYRRELRTARRRERARRIVPFARSRPTVPDGEPTTPATGLPGAVLIAVLVVIGALGALLPIISARPRVLNPLSGAPLASPTTEVGTVGGLLPDLVVNGPKQPVRVRDLRPGVIALVPSKCACAKEISELVGQTHERQPLPTFLIASVADGAELSALVADPLAAGRGATGLTEPTGTLAASYHADPSAPTLLLVGADGRLLREPRALHPGDRLETWLNAPGLFAS